MAIVEQPSLTVFRGGHVAAGEGDTNRTVVWLHGKHDLSTVSELEAALASAMSTDHVGFTIDLSDVRFIDVATLHALAKTGEALRSRSRSFELRSPTPFIALLLEGFGLGRLVTPSSLAASPTPEAASALGSWVSVPVAERADCFDDVAASPLGPPVNAQDLQASGVAVGQGP